MGGLQQMKPDEESKARMLDILKRLHEEEETDGFHEEGMLILCGLLYFSIILQINFVWDWNHEHRWTSYVYHLTEVINLNTFFYHSESLII